MSDRKAASANWVRVVRELSELVMNAVLPWTPLMQETMVAALDIVPALTLKHCANSNKPSLSLFKEKVQDVSCQMLMPFMIQQHGDIYNYGKLQVPHAKFKLLLSTQEELLKQTSHLSWKRLVADAVSSISDAFYPLVADPRIAPGVTPLLRKPVIELLVHD